MNHFDGRQNLSDIQCPVLIVNGTEDLLTPHALSEELNHQINRSKLEWIHGCGHMIPQEKPDVFAQLGIDFFINKVIKSGTRD